MLPLYVLVCFLSFHLTGLLDTIYDLSFVHVAGTESAYLILISRNNSVFKIFIMVKELEGIFCFYLGFPYPTKEKTVIYV